MTALFSFPGLIIGVLTAAIVYILFFRKDQFDVYAKSEVLLPDCFRGWDRPLPGPQEQAENGCESCPWACLCIHREAGL
jgi:hypothetical protein